MVTFDAVTRSNASIRENLPSDIVAVFVGGTSGIGEVTLKLLAKESIKPKIYLVGRSSESAARIIAQCRTLNPDGEYFFIQKSLFLLKAASELCDEIRDRESFINLLFLSVGLPDTSLERNADELRPIFASHLFVRHLIAQRLLPLLQSAPGLRRIVDVAGGAHEDELHVDDWDAERCSRSELRSHLSTMKTLAWQKLGEQAPDVSIIHEFPGLVVTPIFSRITGVVGVLFRLYTTLLGWLLAVPLDESAARHAYMATSSAFAAPAGTYGGVPLVDSISKHVGVDGRQGSGVYSVDWDNEGPGNKIEGLLSRYAKDGTRDKVWERIQGEYVRILGSQPV